MGLRLLRRSPAPAGRHSRAVPGPLVPGAAAALVAAADRWDDPAEPAYAEGALDATAPLEPVAVIPVAPVLLEVPVLRDAPAPVALPAAPAHEPTGAAPEVATVPLASAPVSLGFADGAQVDLDADDPRVRTFRAAAAALLETPRV